MNKRKKGFRHVPDKTTLRKYQKLSAEEKLEWLEEINKFFYRVLPKEKKKIVEDFRAGRI